MKQPFWVQSMLRKKYSSMLLAIVIMVLAFVMIGGSFFLLMLQNGLKGMEKRLGADIMVVPSDCEKQAKGILMEGSREYFYFNGDVLEELKGIRGIESITEQFYLTSLSADCCTSQVQIVGFSPETDFIIKPWIKTEDRSKISAGKAVVGSEIILEKDHTVRIFGKTYEVVSTLAETGTSLDTSVYFSMDTVPELIKNAEKKGLSFLNSQKEENVLSSIFINVEKGVDEKEVVREISHRKGEKTDIIYPENLLKSFSDNTDYLISGIKILLISVWVVAEIILCVIYFISSNGRKKEYALFHLLGVSKNKLRAMLNKQMFFITIAGFFAGVLLSALTVFPFGRYLTRLLGIAYLTPDFFEILLLLLIGFLVSLLSGMVSSIAPMRRVNRQDAYTVLREEE
ncbi:MAG: ABC transporter permease [Lachnospiraceae bacterium]|nr:ABC transporter permease [Lachnospiraceae bacterium]